MATLRWFCISDYNKSSTYAAIALHQFGERDLYFLGDALLSGLHDGGRISQAEVIFASIALSNPEDSLRWLITFLQSSTANEVHSAHWRLLLRLLANSTQSYPTQFWALLYKIDEYLLPRYQDVRQLFIDLFNLKPLYLAVVRNAFTSLNSNLRFIAAQLLVSLYPSLEEAALIFLLNNLEARIRHDEYFRFMLRLSFGKQLLDKVRVLHLRSDNAKLYILLLLFHNDYYLEGEEYEFVVTQMLDKNTFLDSSLSYLDDELPKVLSMDRSYAILRRYFEQDEDSVIRSEACGVLLRYFINRFSDEEKLLLRIISDKDRISSWFFYSLSVMKAIHRRLPESGKVNEILAIDPIIRELILESGDKEAWTELLWKGFTSERASTDIEAFMRYVLNFIRQNISLKPLLGEL